MTAFLPGVRTSDGPLLVRRLSFGAGHRDLCVDNPNWEQVVSALADMDSRYDVLLEGPDTYPYLVICGGRDDKYVVAFGENNAVYYLLNPQHVVQEEVPMSVGGQITKCEADFCIDAEKAVQAIWAFVERGIRLPSAKWADEILARDL